MRKVIVPLLLTAVFAWVSCQNNSKSAQSANGGNGENAEKAAIPDQNDLLKVLQGRWQSEQDATYVLEISDTQMTHTQHNNVVKQANLDVDGACQSPVCKPEGVDTSDGWCFTEMSILEGKYHAECMFVTRCDANLLQFHPLGGNGSGFSFKKIQ